MSFPSAPGLRVRNTQEVFDTGPGSFCFVRSTYPDGSVWTMIYYIPPGTESLRGARITIDEDLSNVDDGMGAKWHWDGSYDAPTLAPSLGCYGDDGVNYEWHGHLVDGFFKGC